MEIYSPAAKAEAVKASSYAMQEFARQIKRTAPQNYELFLSVQGWLVTMFEKGWLEANAKAVRVDYKRE